MVRRAKSTAKESNGRNGCAIPRPIELGADIKRPTSATCKGMVGSRTVHLERLGKRICETSSVELDSGDSMAPVLTTLVRWAFLKGGISILA